MIRKLLIIGLLFRHFTANSEEVNSWDKEKWVLDYDGSLGYRIKLLPFIQHQVLGKSRDEILNLFGNPNRSTENGGSIIYYLISENVKGNCDTTLIFHIQFEGELVVYEEFRTQCG